MSSFVRRTVSQNRKRYVDDKYDLDLTYITDRIIAMGYPSDKLLQSLIRNQIEKVSKYLNEKHRESFKIFNLCSESDYDFVHFNNMVELFPIEDHNPPRFVQIDEFCTSVDNWLKNKDKNVAIIHCKAGKGRTGTMISCYFLYSKKFTSPFDAMEDFDTKRCHDLKGVTIPSQRRFIESYSYYLANKLNYETTSIKLKMIEIIVPKESKNFPNTLRLEIYADYYKKAYEMKRSRIKNENKFTFEFTCPVQLIDDNRIYFLTKRRSKLLLVSFNTFCLNQFEQYDIENDLSCLGKIQFDLENGQVCWYLKKKDIDLAFKNKNIHPDLTIVFKFDLDLTNIPQNLLEKYKLIKEENNSMPNSADSNQSTDLAISKTTKPKLYKSFKKIFN
ncbi:unnamed protein product [Brachionus calyciflorus]|uniref:phosphatidylinositol-3,4,5-trisphosphate 3-phosphatase n=1 Tax=Brachionus calyciflorus TaxID=104777 RepID=A0A813WTS0_9BILA|nr:unnamed protein product [Brachionus calyciflorus]